MRNTNRKICKIFSKNLKYYMDLNGEDRKYLSDELDIKYSTICNWLSCYSYASEDKIEKLAKHFKISKYQLTEDNDKEHIEFNCDLQKRKELLEKSAQLTDAGLDTILTVIDQLLKK